MAGTDGTVDDGASGTAPVPRRARDVVYDALAVAGVLVLLVFPFAAEASVPAAADPGTPAGTSPLPHLPAHPRRGGPLRDLPVFTPGGPVDAAVRAGRPRDRATLDALVADRARAALGPAGAEELLRLVQPCPVPCDVPMVATGAPARETGTAPVRFPAIDALLDRTIGTVPLAADRVGAITDLAGLLLLGARDGSSAPVAYALYDRARRTGGCEAQLDFALLTSTWAAGTTQVLPYAAAVAQYREAVRECPDDPTPRWTLGEFESIEGRAGPAVTNFRHLQRRAPGSVLGWSGEADALVREGYRLRVPAPFTARADFRRAVLLYRRARQLGRSQPRADAYEEDRDRGLLAGEARALAGAGDFQGAADRLDDARRGLGPTVAAVLRARQARYLEAAARETSDPVRRAERFGRAAEVNDGRAIDEARPATTTSPFAPGLFAYDSYDRSRGVRRDGPVGDEAALQPISIGATRLRWFAGLPPAPGLTIPETGAAEDLSFLPEFRSNGSAAATGRCARARDRYLAGTPLPLRPHFGDCSSEAIWTERADPEPARPGGALPSGALTAAQLEDRQDLWRFAGDLERAAAVTRAWRRRFPDDSTAADRAGEIEFLRHRFDRAADDFADAAGDAGHRGTGACPPVDVMLLERLKQGTALEHAGALAEATRVLGEADRLAGARAAEETRSGADVTQLRLVSYNARFQLGETALRADTAAMSTPRRRQVFRAAAAHYAAARRREHQLAAAGADQLDDATLPRPEVLDNNEAIALVRTGRTGPAARAIRRAVATDPANPLFLGNRGYIEQQSGHTAAAVTAYRDAIVADPTAAQAANNLGVLLAGRGELRAATAAFRRAAAARDTAGEGYPTAEFNLGVALARLGPGHALESQGHLAAAIREEPELREHDRTFITDDETVITTLDLSKPLPPRWSLAESEERAPLTVGGVAVAILLVALVQELVKEHVADDVKESTLEAGDRLLTRASRVGDRIPGAAALVAVVAVFAYPLVGSPGTTATDYLLLGAGVAALVFASMRLRLALARRHGITARHHPHVPMLLLAGAGTALGVPVAPMPAPGDHAVIPQRARWTAIGALGLVTAAMLLIGHVTRVPIATALGTAGLVMTASALLPVKPFDGAYLERWHFGLVAGLALGTVAFLVEQGVI